PRRFRGTNWPEACSKSGPLASPRRASRGEPAQNMKIAIAVLLAALLGFGAGAWWLYQKHRQQAAERSSAEAGWQNEKAFLEQALTEARQKQGSVRSVVRTVSTTVTNKLAASEILERL